MKRLLAFGLVFLASITLAQDITNHSMPVGGGPGSVGWKEVGPCAASQAAVWSGVSSDPACSTVVGGPGGLNGEVQYNNAGVFGGLTNVQLTARIQIATAALTGAVPAWPNNTTTFFRGDGTYSAVTYSGITPYGIYYLNAYLGAKSCNTRTIADAGGTAAGTTLSSPTIVFTANDVGRTAVLRGAGAAGAVYTGLITAFIGTTSVTVSPAFSTTVTNANLQVGTDVTTEVNAAVLATKTAGGTLIVNGLCLTDGVNGTNGTPFKIQGSGGDYAAAGFVARSSSTAILDLTGTTAVQLDSLQIGDRRAAATPATGILLAPSTTVLGIDHVRIGGVFVSGYYSAAACYIDRIASSQFDKLACWNFQQSAAVMAMMLTRNNLLSISSSFATTYGSALSVSDLVFTASESHAGKDAAGATVNYAIHLDGALNTRWYGGNIDGSGSVMLQSTTNGGTSTTRTLFSGTQFYTENGTNPSNVFGGAGDYLELCLIDNAFPTAALFAMSGTRTNCTIYANITGTNPTTQAFTSGTAATYTPTSGTKWIEIHAWGAGASGGGCAISTGSNAAASGGGGGAYVYDVIASPAATYTYTVGVKGAAPTAGNNPGNAGTATTVNVNSISAGGGAAGLGSAAVAGGGLTGGVGGVGAGGKMFRNGAAGGNGLVVNASFAIGGMGGNGPPGPNATNANGLSAVAGSRGGGTGCGTNNDGSARSGGAGDDGFLLFVEHYGQ